MNALPGCIDGVAWVLAEDRVWGVKRLRFVYIWTPVWREFFNDGCCESSLGKTESHSKAVLRTVEGLVAEKTIVAVRSQVKYV